MDLYDGLKEEIERVKEIKKEYDKIPAGVFAAAMMQHDILLAEQALKFSDVVQMMQSLKSLKEYKL